MNNLIFGDRHRKWEQEFDAQVRRLEIPTFVEVEGYAMVRKYGWPTKAGGPNINFDIQEWSSYMTPREAAEKLAAHLEQAIAEKLHV